MGAQEAGASASPTMRFLNVRSFCNMGITPKYKIGDRFVTHGRGYKEIWEICTRTFNPYQGEHTYDLVSIRISPGHEIFDLSEDTLTEKYRKLEN